MPTRGLLALVVLAGVLIQQSALATAAHVRFAVDLVPGKSSTAAQIIVRQQGAALREIVLDGARLQNAEGDGEIGLDKGQLRWLPPASGGTLRYRVTLSHRREGKAAGGHDSWVGQNFAVFRGEDAFPIKSWRRAKGTALTGELAIQRPEKWGLITPYLPDARGRLQIRNPGKRLPRPIGWITAGDIGTRRDTVADIEITVTAPRGLRMERVAMLGLLRWTLPQLVQQLTTAETRPRYVSVVSAGPPLWLGALSAPNSIFVHADRPLISENGTSTIVHEMVHVLLADLDTPRDQDWIDEGLAEYLSLRALKDSGTISAARYDATIAEFRRWGASVKSLRTTSSTGPVTARAVTVFADLDTELRKSSKNQQSLARVVSGTLQSTKRLDLETLRLMARRSLGRDALALTAAALPGLD